MSDVYILSNVGKLGKRDETLIFSKPDGTTQVLFPFKVEQLMLIGKVSISGDALRMLSKYRIPVSFISTNGYFNARLVYANNKNVFLRQQQYRLMDNPAQTLQVAKGIVIGKIKNQLSFMQRIKRKTTEVDAEIQTAITRIKQLIEKAETITSLESLRGIEGNASKWYFSVFRYNIKPSWAEFPNRTKNPPRSNVNAVLSFLYTVLTTKIHTVLETQGLDPMAGTLHANAYGAAALAFDLVEELRTPIADTICCALFNLGMLKPEDFECADFSPDSSDYPCELEQSEQKVAEAVLLTEEGLKKVIAAFQEKMNKLAFSGSKKKSISYNELIFKQITAYKNMLNGQQPYTPYYFK
jgi:hypothetical protein